MTDREKGEYVAAATTENDTRPATFKRPTATSAGPSTLDGILNHPALPVVAYCVSSILMTVVNKFVVSGRDFNMNFLLLGVQSFVCVAVVLTFKRLGTINFRDFSSDDARKWFPISSLLVAVIYTGSKSLQFLSIPVYTIFKNLTIILIAYGEVLWFGGHVTALTLVSFGMMIASSVVAAWADISGALASMSSSTTVNILDPATGVDVPVATNADVLSAVSALNAGYLWMLINCLASAAYVLTMRKRIKVTGFKDWDSMFYNNLLSIPVLVLCSFLVENWKTSNLNLNFPPEGRPFFLFAIAFSGAAAVLISYNTAWCLRATSSTTYSMVGALNKLPVAASGMIFFGDPVTVGSVSAISLGFVAGLVYAVAKNNQSKAQKLQGASIIPMSASSAAVRDANGPK